MSAITYSVAECSSAASAAQRLMALMLDEDADEDIDPTTIAAMRERFKREMAALVEEESDAQRRLDKVLARRWTLIAALARWQRSCACWQTLTACGTR